MNNPIIQEVRATRESLAAKFNFDLHDIIANAIQRQAQHSTVNRQASTPKALPGAVVTRSSATSL